MEESYAVIDFGPESEDSGSDVQIPAKQQLSSESSEDEFLSAAPPPPPPLEADKDATSQSEDDADVQNVEDDDAVNLEIVSTEAETNVQGPMLQIFFESTLTFYNLWLNFDVSFWGHFEFAHRCTNLDKTKV